MVTPDLRSKIPTAFEDSMSRAIDASQLAASVASLALDVAICFTGAAGDDSRGIACGTRCDRLPPPDDPASSSAHSASNSAFALAMRAWYGRCTVASVAWLRALSFARPAWIGLFLSV